MPNLQFLPNYVSRRPHRGRKRTASQRRLLLLGTPNGQDLAAEEVAPVEVSEERLRESLLARCRADHIEPPGRVERIVGAARAAASERFCATTVARLGADAANPLERLVADHHDGQQLGAALSTLPVWLTTASRTRWCHPIPGPRGHPQRQSVAGRPLRCRRRRGAGRRASANRCAASSRRARRSNRPRGRHGGLSEIGTSSGLPPWRPCGGHRPSPGPAGLAWWCSPRRCPPAWASGRFGNVRFPCTRVCGW